MYSRIIIKSYEEYIEVSNILAGRNYITNSDLEKRYKEVWAAIKVDPEYNRLYIQMKEGYQNTFDLYRAKPDNIIFQDSTKEAYRVIVDHRFKILDKRIKELETNI